MDTSFQCTHYSANVDNDESEDMDMHPDDDEAWRHDLNLFESDKSATRRPGDFGVLGLGDPGKPLKGEEVSKREWTEMGEVGE